jgi:hypothetical protein
MYQRMSLVRSCLGILALCCLTSPAFSGQILFDAFNGTGGVPKNWIQVLGAPGDITERPHDLTITDSTGQSAGLACLTALFDGSRCSRGTDGDFAFRLGATKLPRIPAVLRR